MVLEEISFQPVIDGVFPKLIGDKGKGWTNFPFNLGSLVIQNSTHVILLGKKITTLNLGKTSRRMHDPKSFLANHFTQEHTRSSYVHQTNPNDSFYQGVIIFSEVLNKTYSQDEKIFIYQYQQDLNSKLLKYRKLELSLQEKAHKNLVQKETQKD